MIDVLQTTERPGDAFESNWRRAIKRRIVFILVTIACWGTAAEARLLWLQVVQHDFYVAKAKRQQRSTVTLPALRGDILDRRGEFLASSADAPSIWADPTDVEDPIKAAAALCQALGDCSSKDRDDLFSKLTKNNTEFVWLRRWRTVSTAQAAKVAELKLPGISIMTERGRYYPDKDLAAHVIGYVGLDNRGLGGIEAAFDDQIRGQVGELLVLRDGEKHRVETRLEQVPTAGSTIELTIDRGFQYIAQRELEAAVKANKAAGGTVIIMDPHTGEILALANYPTFNPNSYQQYPADVIRNRATQDVYEPGSTFKMVTASAALQEGVFTRTDFIDTNPGVMVFPGRKPITEASHHNYGVLTFEDVLVKSSNIGAIKVGLRVGAERLGSYVHRFGFGERHADDFKGESAGIVWSPTNMSDSTLASISMGYNVSVTPLQMVTAASAVANGGTLYEPHVVGAIVRDGRREVVPPKAIRQAINQETAATVTTFMEGVVQRGTATAAQLEGYQVAGKTGTARKLENGHYVEEYNASFVGFVPSRQPVYTILVVIDTPRAGPTVGGLVAAPVFKRIAEALLQRSGVAPTVHPRPPVMISADADRVSATAALPVTPPTVVRVASDSGEATVMPDLRGLPASEALRALNALGLVPKMRGTGFVVSQSPEPGRVVDHGETGAIELRRGPDPQRSSGGRQR